MAVVLVVVLGVAIAGKVITEGTQSSSTFKASKISVLSWKITDAWQARARWSGQEQAEASGAQIP